MRHSRLTGLVMILPFKELMTKCSIESKLTTYLFRARLVFWFACYCDIKTVNADPWIEYWAFFNEIWKTSDSFVENLLNPIYILPNPLLKSEYMKFGCNVSKDTWLEKRKSKFPPHCQMQLSCNNVCKKTLVFKCDLFKVFLHCLSNFMNVLILGSDHINCAWN